MFPNEEKKKQGITYRLDSILDSSTAALNLELVTRTEGSEEVLEDLISTDGVTEVGVTVSDGVTEVGVTVSDGVTTDDVSDDGEVLTCDVPTSKIILTEEDILIV